MHISRYFIKSAKVTEMKIALIADLHDRPCRDVLAALKSEKPDIITIAGDLTNRRLNPDSQSLCLLRHLAEIAPTFYAFGNHEARFNENDIRLISDTGVMVLNNEYCRFGEICIGGQKTGFDGSYKRISPPPMSDWLNDFEKQTDFKLLICHHPEYYMKYIANRDIDLIVSGHAHGGQIRIFDYGLFSPAQGFFPKYTKGVFDGRLVVSAGLSNTTKIPRINNPTELVIVTVIN